MFFFLKRIPIINPNIYNIIFSVVNNNYSYSWAKLYTLSTFVSFNNLSLSVNMLLCSYVLLSKICLSVILSKKCYSVTMSLKILASLR